MSLDSLAPADARLPRLAAGANERRQAAGAGGVALVHGFGFMAELAPAAETASAAAIPKAGPPTFIHGPYKDLTLSIDRAEPVISTTVDGKRVPVVTLLTPGSTLQWAFAIGECGSETLGGLDAQQVADANIGVFVRAGVGYVISSGGQGGVFTCGTDAGMQAFIARYASPRLVGLDFDIKASQTPETIDALVQRVVVAQRRHPELRFTFTLPTSAATDASRASLDAQGRVVLQAIRKHRLARYTINLMTMDYGPPSPANCVVDRGLCDMGASAIQAARNLHAVYGIRSGRSR